MTKRVTRVTSSDTHGVGELPSLVVSFLGTVGSTSVATVVQHFRAPQEASIRGRHLGARVLGLFQLLDERIGVVFGADTALAGGVGQ